MLIREYYDKKSKPGSVGIEVEAEWPDGKAPLVENIGAWRFDKDNSLSNGLEYITRQPLKVDGKLFSRIQELTDRLKETGAKEFAPRGSVHVHVNVLELTPSQVWAAATAYWLLEDAIMSFFHTTRHGNLFCLRLSDAEGIIKQGVKDIKSGGTPFASLDQEKAKYGGLNLATVPLYGSLEFRGMHYTLNHQMIGEWAHCVNHLVNTTANTFGNPTKVVEYVLDANAHGLADTILSGSIRNHCLSYSTLKTKVRDNIGRVSSLAYAVDDWTKWEESSPKLTPPSKKTLNVLPTSTSNYFINEPIFSEMYDD